MLSTSTSSENGPAGTNDFAASERQQAAGNAPKRPIPVACDQNSNNAPAVVVDLGSDVTDRLADAQRAWTARQDRRALIRALLELVASLHE